jgi:tetratricopeptide (TPR) repeat protein
LPLAGQTARKAVDTLARGLPAQHPYVGSGLALMGEVLLAQGAPDEAEQPLRQALEIRRAKAPAAWRTFQTAGLLGQCLAALGYAEEAEPLLIEAYERIGAVRKGGDPQVVKALERVTRFLEQIGDAGRADEYRQRLADGPAPSP